MREVRILQLSVLHEVHKLLLSNGILRNHLLHRSMESHTDRILIESAVGEVEYADVARTIAIVSNGELYATKVVEEIVGVVALGELAMFLLQLIKEILQILGKHGLRAVRSYGNIGRSDEMSLCRLAENQFGANAIEVATKV